MIKNPLSDLATSAKRVLNAPTKGGRLKGLLLHLPWLHLGHLGWRHLLDRDLRHLLCGHL